MICRISLTRVSDGKTVEYEQDDYGYGTTRFIYEDGNYSCNCNRHLFFTEAEGHRDDTEMNCVDYPKYRVNWIKEPEGEIIYSEA